MNLLDFEIDEKLYKKLLAIGIIAIIIFLLLNMCAFVVPKNYKVENDTIIDEEGMVKNGVSKLNRGRISLEIDRMGI